MGPSSDQIEPKIPPALQHLMASLYHVADRAWSGLQSFLVVQSILAIAWASITSSVTWTHRWPIAALISLIGILTGFQWSFMLTRMWHYHLEYATRLRSLTERFSVQAQGPGATIWAEVDAAIDEYWRNRDLGWFKWISGNLWILFLAPLFLATLHLTMLFWVLWGRPDWGQYAAIGAAVLFAIGLFAVWTFCEPLLNRDFYGVLGKATDKAKS